MSLHVVRGYHSAATTVGDEELSGEALYNALGEVRQNVFVNVTDELGSITLANGSSALSQVQGVEAGARNDVFGPSFVNFATDTGLKDSLLATGGFGEPLGPGNLRATQRTIGGLELSFDAHPGLNTMKGDVDIGNFANGVIGGAVHVFGELLVNDVAGRAVEFFGGKRNATNQNQVRRILLRDKRVRVTPSTDPRFNRRR